MLPFTAPSSSSPPALWGLLWEVTEVYLFWCQGIRQGLCAYFVQAQTVYWGERRRKSRQSLILALCDLEGLLCSQKLRWAGLQALLWEDPSLSGFVGDSAPEGTMPWLRGLHPGSCRVPWPPLGPYLGEGFCSIEQL